MENKHQLTTIFVFMIFLSFHTFGTVSARGELWKCSGEAQYVSPTSNTYEKLKGKMVQYRPGKYLIGGIFSIHQPNKEDRCGKIIDSQIHDLEAFNLRIDELNKRNVFGGTVGSIVLDSCDSEIHTMEQIFHCMFPIYDKETKESGGSHLVGIVENVHSPLLSTLNGLLHVINVPLIATRATSSILTEEKYRFPNLFRTQPSDTYLVKATLKLLQKMGWKYFSVVYDEDLWGQQGYAAIKLAHREYGLCMATNQFVKNQSDPEHLDQIINNLAEKSKARVVILITMANVEVLKAAERNSKTKGRIVWVILNGELSTLPDQSEISSFNKNNLISLRPLSYPVKRLEFDIDKINVTSSISTKSKQFRRNPWFAEYYQKSNNCTLPEKISPEESGKPICNYFGERSKPSNYIHYYMQGISDSVDSIGKALEEYNKHDENLYSNDKVGKQLLKIMQRKQFSITRSGKEGKEEIPFGYPEEFSSIEVTAFTKQASSKGDWKIFGNFTENEIQLDSSFKQKFVSVISQCSFPCRRGEKAVRTSPSSCCWTCVACGENQIVVGEECVECAIDETPDSKRRNCTKLQIQPAAMIAWTSVLLLISSVVGACFVVVVASIYFSYRHTPIVKASGKELCVLIWLGAILCFANGVINYAGTTDVSCAFSRVLVVLGLQLLYAALLIKTLRVVIVFTVKHNLTDLVKRVLRPKAQVMLTLLLSSVGVLVLVLWWLSNPALTMLYRERSAVFTVCTDFYELTNLAVLAFPFTLLLLSMVLATVNRNVPEGFNETRVVIFATYAVFMTWMCFFGVYFASGQKKGVRAMAANLCVNVNALVVNLCLFLPRCLLIVFHPDRNNRREVMRKEKPSVNSSETARSTSTC